MFLRLLLLIFSLFIDFIYSFSNFTDSNLTITTIFNIPTGLWCPTFEIGLKCPEETFLSYHKCCGNLNKDCCHHLKVEILILIIVLPISLITPTVIYIIHCLCHKKSKKSQKRENCEEEEPSMGRHKKVTILEADSMTKNSEDMVVL
ncbi:unnamed protein product [Caenorhabditis angaria]|uniref:Uncharacterized protein n=1 Tax=Caenorhabditis angaria TaxID=860376 RepID=A0A9P1INM8_9PELO|nr:unnamed protein product [Caenorhabditis angaria]